MPLLATRLGETRHVSSLMRKARSLGLAGPSELLTLAVQRGCDHYSGSAGDQPVNDPGIERLSTEELAVLLMLGEHPFDATALRCAAQLMSGPQVDPRRLAALARRERCGRVLAHIARAGCEHYEAGRDFWVQLLSLIPSHRPVDEGILPHWTRFVALTGARRYAREIKSVWLRPRP